MNDIVVMNMCNELVVMTMCNELGTMSVCMTMYLRRFDSLEFFCMVYNQFIYIYIHVLACGHFFCINKL